jgi:hypothetical protein
MKTIKLKLIRPGLLFLIRMFGTNIRDARTGEIIGRVLFVPWRGKILVLGPGLDLLPEFLPQPRQSFWKYELGFTRHQSPDFPNEWRP